MPKKTLAYYTDAFSKMNRAVMRGQKAPHKPILLYAIINLVNANVIVNNHIVLSDELIREFKRIWSLLIDNEEEQNFQVSEGLTIELVNKYPFKCSIENPFFHMNNEPFWSLVKSSSYEERKTYTSISVIRKNFLYAVLDDELFSFMKNDDNCKYLKSALRNLL